ncbi:hypothetical protein [Pararhodonellum marinum]|uniref:hypothetical protein n=1 Tax=Pararhodonellum marinum TaxID=2755358 RepID=UPI00188E1EE1|nr:hypothetical protein [Pararhodonellum marinum]
MKKILLFFVLLVPFALKAQERGIGVRLGEPLSITYKSFFTDKISFEGMFGRAGVNNPQYYRRSFDNNRPTPNAVYLSHSASSSFSLNIRGAYHEDITDQFSIDEGILLAYGGVGAQLRRVSVDFLYNDPTSSSSTPLMESRGNMDFGPEGFVGTEYYFANAPINVFAEVGMFIEILDRPGHVKLQGGVGIRYLF